MVRPRGTWEGLSLALVGSLWVLVLAAAFALWGLGTILAVLGRSVISAADR